MPDASEQNFTADNVLQYAKYSQSGCDEETEQCYQVEEVINHRFDEHNVLEYLVKWKGYDDPKYNTWEPEDHLHDVQEDLMAYHVKCGYVPGFNEDRKLPRRKIRGRPRIKYADQCFKGKTRSNKHVSVSASHRERLNGRAGRSITSWSRTPLRPLTETTSLATTVETSLTPREYPSGSWERLIVRIGPVVSDHESIDPATLCRSVAGWMASVEWIDGHSSDHDIQTLEEHCPRRMCKWYSRHLYLAEGEKHPSLSQDHVPRYARRVDGTWRVSRSSTQR